jgi:hypothetical protein
VAIYTPNTARDVVLPMPTEIAERLKDKSVRIAYVSTDASRPDELGALLAEMTVQL